MSIASDLDIMLKLDESTGKNLTDSSTNNSPYTIGPLPTNPTDFSWVTNADTTLSYWLVNPSAQYVFATTALAVPGTSMETINCSLKLRVISVTGGTQIIFNHASGSSGCQMVATANGGGFDLTINVTDNFARNATYAFTALTLGSDYVCSWTHDSSTAASTVIRAKLNAAAVVTGATVDHSAGTFPSSWPTLFDSGSGLGTKRLYWWAFQRGGTAWTSSDLDSINADPTLLWSSGTVTVTPQTGIIAPSGSSAAIIRSSRY